MKRYLPCLLAAILTWPSGSALGQSTPEPGAPVAPVPPVPPDPNVRRHRMGDGSSVRLNTDAQFKAALEAHLDELRQRVAELEELLREKPDAPLQAELERLKEQLAALDSLEPLALPEVVLLDPDRPGRVLWNRDGNEVVILDPEGEFTQKTRGEKVTYFKHIYVNHDDWIEGPVVALLGNVHVLGHVEEDVVSIGGNVYVDGTVGGNVVAPFGDVYLNGDALVEGDVVAVSVFPDDEASIGGKIEEVPLFRLPWVNGGPQALLMLASTVAITKLCLSLLLGFLIQAVSPLHVARVQERLRQKPVGSFFGGVLVQILVLPVFVLLLVTVIGIPLALLALPLLVVVALLLGFVASARILGDSLLNQDGKSRSPSLLFGAGALVLYSPLIVASVLVLTSADAGGSLTWAINLLFFLGVCLLYFVYTAGMGAATFSRLGTRSLANHRKAALAGAGAYPPAPKLSALPQAPPAADPS